MFSENEKISARQLYRSIVVSLSGATLLVCPKIAERFGEDGIFVYILAGVLTVVYVALMLMCRRSNCQCEQKVNNEEVMSKAGVAAGIKIALNTMLRVILCVKLLLLAIGGLYLIVDVVSSILLPETHIFLVILVIISGLIYWNQGSIESSARAYELLFYWILVPIAIVIAVALPKVEIQNVVPTLSGDFLDIFYASILMWILFSPAEILVLCGDHYKKDKKTDRAVWRGVSFLIIGNVITYETILGIYGAAGMNQGGTYPLLKVMQISGIPGDFLRRVDGFMSLFLVLSLFCGMVMLLDYMGISLWQICDYFSSARDKNKNRNRKLIFSFCVTGVMAISAYLLYQNISVENDPFVDGYGEKKIVSGVELEDRGFVMSVIVGEDTVTFELASDEEGAWREESKYVTLDTGKITEAEKIYKENGDKRLDFTHMKIIFIAEDIYNEDITAENLKYMYEQEKFAENLLVCVLSRDLKKMAADAMENEEAFAVIIENIMENSKKGEGMELYQVYQSRKLKEKPMS